MSAMINRQAPAKTLGPPSSSPCFTPSVHARRHLVIRHGYAASPEEAHLVESRSIKWVSGQADVREGIASFLQKRPPAWRLDPFADSPDWFPWWREVATLSRL